MARAHSGKVQELTRAYTDWHWGSEPTKLIRVQDPLVPDVVGIGRLKSFTLDTGEIHLPDGCWIAFDKKHPRERIHVVVTPAQRERNRNDVKHASVLKPLQRLAEATGGDQADYPLPNIQAAPLGVLRKVLYHTHKAGEEGNRWYDYEHVFGREHSKGIVPILACDVSGRLWICGGSYRCPLAGITG